MNRKKLWTYGTFIALTQALGGLSAFLTRDGMKQIQRLPQSVLTPPGFIFFIVWTILYTLMAIGAARVWMTEPGQERSRGLWLFVYQLIFNFFWSILYFNMEAFALALLWLIVLWVLILMMIRSFAKTDGLAAKLQIPYLIWVAFAGYLNFVMWRLN